MIPDVIPAPYYNVYYYTIISLGRTTAFGIRCVRLLRVHCRGAATRRTGLVVWQNLARNGGKTGTSTEEFIRSTLEEANCQYFAEG